MSGFAKWLGAAPATAEAAFTAHSRLIAIHPFNDGNGRTARLLMNLILIRAGYPPITVRPEDRPAYIRALQHAQAGHGDRDLNGLLHQRLDAILAEYLSALEASQPPAAKLI
jgi:Fic family protein